MGFAPKSKAGAGQDVLSMTEVLRQTSNHFARTKKKLKDSSGIEAREVERYREVVKKCSFTGQGSGFAYHRSFAVGETLYQYFARPKSRRTRLGTARVVHRHRPRLKLLIPDTMVFNVEDDPQWFYTDKNGFVACMEEYDPGQAVEVFGDVRFEDDLAAVRKQSCLLPYSGLREGDDKAALYSNGNSLSLVNTRDLRLITRAGVLVDGGGPASATDGGEPFVIQKFVKSKGPHAFIIRQTVERGLPPTAWVISNTQPFGEETAAPDSLLIAGPALIGRFVTTPAKDRACGIARLGPGACVETADAAARVLHHLEAVLERGIQVLVADFTRDDRGRLWMLQVKAFRFIGCAPRRPFRLTSRARRDACCRLVGGTPLVSPPDGRDRGTTETGRKGRDGKCEGQREKRTNTGVGEEDIQSAREGWTDDEDREAASAEGIVGRKISCGMCGALLAPEDVSFRMTTKMVRETLFHIWSRLSHDEVPRCLRITENETHPGDATASAAAFMARTSAVGGAASGGKGAVASILPSASTTYRNVHVCEACFTLHQTEALLLRAERRLAAAAGAPRRGSCDKAAIQALDDGAERGAELPARGATGASQRRGTCATRMTGRGERANGRRSCHREDCAAVNALDVPAELTLCRCLIAITDVLDVPTAFLHEAAAHSRSLQLRYEFLGRREAIKLENPVLKGGFATATREGNAGGGQDGGDLRPEDLPPGDLPPEDEGLVRVPVNSLRVHSFLAADTPLTGDLQTGSGLHTFITRQREVVLTLSLTARRMYKRNRTEARSPERSKERSRRFEEGPAGRGSERAGDARLGLGQFRNDNIRKIELQAPLLLSGGQCGGKPNLVLVKALLGLERVRSKVNISTLSNPLVYHRGIYIIDADCTTTADGFHTSDPLPDEWVEIGRCSKPSTAIAAIRKSGGGRRLQDWQSPKISRRLAERQPSLSEEVLEASSDSVWGICLCIAGVHRPNELGRAQAIRNTQHKPNVGSGATPNPLDARNAEHEHDGVSNENPRATVLPPTLNKPKGWRIRCSLFGHTFDAEHPVGASPPEVTGVKTTDIEGERGKSSGLPLGGVEAHAYLQCGISRLRRLLGGDETKLNAAALTVEALHKVEEGGRGESGNESIRCRCEVPLETLVDSRYIEGTYPLFDGTPIETTHPAPLGRPQRRSPCQSGGAFEASLELAVHLYRMGPLNHYKTCMVGGEAGGRVGDLDDATVRWKPPSLVERGRVRLDGGRGDVILFERPPTEPRRTS